MKNILLTVLFLFSFSSNANVSIGDKITAKKFNESTNHVGDIKQSLLTQSQFQSLQGNCWVRMVGQDVSGSDYASITGKNTLPNTAGRFLRDTGGNAPSLGQNQGDAIRNIVGEAYGSENAMNGASGTGAFLPLKKGTTGHEPDNDAEGTEFTGWSFSAARALPNGTTTDPVSGENRPINTAVNFFVKINHECE